MAKVAASKRAGKSQSWEKVADRRQMTTSVYENEELAEQLLKWISESSPKVAAWRREEAKPCYGFVAGDQWDAEDVAQLNKELRAPITYNRIGPMVNAVAGAEISNRKKVKYSPREVSDSPLNENLTEAADWVRDRTNAEDEESDAFRDCLISGLGWTETRMDYEENEKGDISIKRISPLEMGWDTKATQSNLSDTRFRWREKEMRREDVEDMIGGELPESVFGSTVNEPAPIAHVDSQDDYGSRGNASLSDSSAETDRMVTVRHIQWWDREKTWEVNGQQLNEQQAEELNAKLQSVGMPELQTKIRKVYRMAMMVGRTFLAEPVVLPCGFTFVCMTGQRDENTGDWYGLVRAMIDPQRWSNKFLSQILHIVNSNAKGGYFVEADAFVDANQAAEEIAKPDSLVYMNPGAIAKGKIQPKVPPPVPAMLTNLMQFSIQSITDVTGISRELMGIVEHEQAGVLEYQRKQAGYALLAPFFDAMRRYHVEQGHVLLYFLRYIGDGRLIRILGEDQAQYVPFMFKPDVIEYDVVVDEAPAGPNQKETTWRMITEMIPLLAKWDLPIEAWLELAKYSPLPTSLTTKLREIMQQSKQNSQGQQMQMQMIMLQMQKVQAEIQKLQSDATLNMAKATAENAGILGINTEQDPWAEFMGHQDALRKTAETTAVMQGVKPQDHTDEMAQYERETAAANTAKAKTAASMELLAGIEKLRASGKARKEKKGEKNGRV